MSAEIVKFPRKVQAAPATLPSDLLLAQSCADAAAQALIAFAANPSGLNDPMAETRAIAGLFTGGE